MPPPLRHSSSRSTLPSKSTNRLEGTRTPDHYGLEITLRYNQNTLEQTVLAAIAWMGLVLALPHDQLIVIPAMAFLFFFGRITFWIGYRLHPLARTFGMVLTALPHRDRLWLARLALARHVIVVSRSIPGGPGRTS